MPKRKQQAEEDSPSVDEEQQYKTDSSSSTSDSDAPLPDSEESSDDEAGEAFQQVDVDFGFYCPQEKDFLGMRTLMQNYLDGQEWACSDMVEAIIAQGDSAGVGSVIKCGEEDDPIGVSTVLNLARHADATPLRQLRDFLLAAAGSTHRRRLEQAWAAPATGLIINERLVNSPPELSEPLQTSLFGEVQEAAEDEELSKEERQCFDLQQFLMVVRAYTDPSQQPDNAAGGSGSGAGAGSSKQQQQQKRKKAQAQAQAQAEGVVHFLPEAECYQAVADWSFCFPAADRVAGEGELQPCRVVMLISAAAAAKARTQLATLLQAAQDE